MAGRNTRWEFCQDSHQNAVRVLLQGSFYEFQVSCDPTDPRNIGLVGAAFATGYWDSQ